MTDTVLNAINVSNPQREMDALTAKVAELTTMCLDMTKLCIDVQSDTAATAATAAMNAATAASAATAAAFAGADATDNAIWAQGDPRTPAQMEALFPPGPNDGRPFQVVCIGREPGLYATADEANVQLLGVPNQFRLKKDTRAEALAYYRFQYNAGKVQKWTEVWDGVEDDAAA
ncbi:hypothetical protein B0H17DRAFT_1204939 [Mycena rosella]|uniref:Uncharacterized protein n=1 Tax=Mycena rosella TaxID=1033263 RepID=A0AAD7D8H1_MYCRO|nr:hypothetical protein B0H17DRAFT_1204939 [Mycena rosella]